MTSRRPGGNGPPSSAPRPGLQPFCLCLCGAGAGLRAGQACGAARSLRETRSGVSWTRQQGPPKHHPERTLEKNPKLLLSHGFCAETSAPNPHPARPRPRHSPMSPSSSSSSCSSMFSRTFLVIICMSPQDRRSAPLGSTRLRSVAAASSAQPSRRSRAALRPRSASLAAQQRLSMPRETPPLPPQIKPPRVRGAGEEVRTGVREGQALGALGCACGTRCSPTGRPAPRGSRGPWKLCCRMARRPKVPGPCGGTPRAHGEPSVPARGSPGVGGIVAGCSGCKSDLKAPGLGQTRHSEV